MTDTASMRASLNLAFPTHDTYNGISTEFTFTFDDKTDKYQADQEEIRSILHTVLTRYEYLFTSNPSLLTTQTTNNYSGLLHAHDDLQLSVTHELGPHIFFWLNSAMYTYGITAIISGEIHTVQRLIHTPRIIFAAEHALRQLHHN